MEYIWHYWKKHELPNLCAKDLVELGSFGRAVLRRMRRRPVLAASFWKQAELSLQYTILNSCIRAGPGSSLESLRQIPHDSRGSTRSRHGAR